MSLFIFLLLLTNIILNIFNYNLFLKSLSITWYFASMLIIYSGLKYTIKYKLLQINFKEIINAIKSKSNNNVKPLSSLSISLAAKIGVGSLSGVALALYYGGLGSIFWMCIISLLVSINTYKECLFGIKHRSKTINGFIGGPSFYISKCLKNKNLSYLYSFLIIITYSGLFLSIQSNTIVNIFSTFNINISIIVIILTLIILLIVLKGISTIISINSILVPFMIVLYFILGLYTIIGNVNHILYFIKLIIKEAFNIKCIIPTFLIGMQRAIFITESGIGTSAISASTCDNNGHKQGMLEVLGIHITTFIICFVTFIIVVTSNYRDVVFSNLNGIDLVMYAFNYHFGSLGRLLLSIITILFAVSTIISGYLFGENNLRMFTSNTKIINLFKISIILIIFMSGYISPKILWNLTDYFIALLAIINIYSILKIDKNN